MGWVYRCFFVGDRDISHTTSSCLRGDSSHPRATGSGLDELNAANTSQTELVRILAQGGDLIDLELMKVPSSDSACGEAAREATHSQHNTSTKASPTLVPIPNQVPQQQSLLLLLLLLSP